MGVLFKAQEDKLGRFVRRRMDRFGQSDEHFKLQGGVAPLMFIGAHGIGHPAPAANTDSQPNGIWGGPGAQTQRAEEVAERTEGCLGFTHFLQRSTAGGNLFLSLIRKAGSFPGADFA